VANIDPYPPLGWSVNHRRKVEHGSKKGLPKRDGSPKLLLLEFHFLERYLLAPYLNARPLQFILFYLVEPSKRDFFVWLYFYLSPTRRPTCHIRVAIWLVPYMWTYFCIGTIKIISNRMHPHSSR